MADATLPTPTAPRLELRPSTSSVLMDGRIVGHLSHPTNDTEHGRYSAMFIAYAYTTPTRSDFFDTEAECVAFVAEAFEAAKAGR